MTDILQRLVDAQLDHNAWKWGWAAEAADEIRKLRLECEAMTRSRDDLQATASRIKANLEQYSQRAENDIAELTRERDVAISAQAKAERERDHAWETCKRALHKVDDLTARADKTEKDLDDAEVDRDKIEKGRDIALADLANLHMAFENWKVYHSTSRLESEHAAELYKLRQGIEELKADLAAALALLQEARETWIKVGHGASHEDVAECRDLCSRIDAALAGEKR